MKKLIWILQGYDSEDSTGKLANVITVELFGKSENEVSKMAKKMIKKKFWRVSNIIEKDVNCK